MRDLLNILDSIDMIVESPKSDFKQMFQNFPKDAVETHQIAKENFDWAYRTFQTNGKPNGEHILWYMRCVRLFLLSNMAKNVEGWQKSFDKELAKMSGNMQIDPKELTRLAKTMTIAPYYKNSMEHYKSLGLENIDNMTFGWTDPVTLEANMRKVEEKWKENQRFNISMDDYDKKDNSDFGDRNRGKPEKLIDFGDGFAWWNLNRPSCSIEGNAMGHCGNSPRSMSQDTVLSLRKQVKEKGKTYFQPYLTFILTEDGNLTEMKGRFNEKPKSDLHPYIVALLKHDAIKGIEGGGYLPQNNFSLSDLDDEEREELEDAKPELKNPLSALYEKDFKDVTQEELDKLDDKMRERNVAPYQMVKEENRIVIETFGDLETFVNDKFEYDHPVHNLFKILDDVDNITDIADFEAEDLDDRYYVELIRRLPNWYQDRIFKEAGTDDPERAFWKLERERHRFYEYMVDAFQDAHTFDLNDEYKGNLEEYEGMTFRGAIERRIKKYVDYTPLNPYDVGLVYDGLEGEVTMYVDNHYVLINAWEAAGDDEYAYETFDQGDIYEVMQNGWGFQESTDRYSYDEIFGKYAQLGEDRLIDENDNDRLINELSGNAGSIKMIDALDNFEKRFDMREEKEPSDNMLQDIIRLAKI